MSESGTLCDRAKIREEFVRGKVSSCAEPGTLQDVFVAKRLESL